jgi:hypothetical protein
MSPFGDLCLTESMVCMAFARVRTAMRFAEGPYELALFYPAIQPAATPPYHWPRQDPNAPERDRPRSLTRRYHGCFGRGVVCSSAHGRAVSPATHNSQWSWQSCAQSNTMFSLLHPVMLHMLMWVPE